MNQVSTNRKPAINKRQAFVRHYVANGFNATQAMQQVIPNSTYGYQRKAASIMVSDRNTQEAIAGELAKVMSAEEVKERISKLAREAGNDTHKLKALELMSRIHALLVDKQEVTSRELPQVPADVKALETDQLVSLVIDRLKLSSLGIGETPEPAGEGKSELPHDNQQQPG